jgi:hypothetical protein
MQNAKCTIEKQKANHPSAALRAGYGHKGDTKDTKEDQRKMQNAKLKSKSSNAEDAGSGNREE